MRRSIPSRMSTVPKSRSSSSAGASSGKENAPCGGGPPQGRVLVRRTRACVISSPRSGAGAPSAVAPTAAVRPAPLSSSADPQPVQRVRGEQADRAHLLVLGQRGAVQGGEHRLHPGEPSRSDGVQDLGRAGEPRVRVQDRLLDREDQLEPLAPAADLGADDGGPPGRAVGHEAQHLVLGRDVAVQGHRGEPERLGEPGHRHALDPLRVGQRDARVGDLLQRETRAGGRAGREQGCARARRCPAGGPPGRVSAPATRTACRRAFSASRAACCWARAAAALGLLRLAQLPGGLADRLLRGALLLLALLLGLLGGVLLGPQPVALAALGVLLGVRARPSRGRGGGASASLASARSAFSRSRRSSSASRRASSASRAASRASSSSTAPP